MGSVVAKITASNSALPPDCLEVSTDGLSLPAELFEALGEIMADAARRFGSEPAIQKALYFGKIISMLLTGIPTQEMTNAREILWSRKPPQFCARSIICPVIAPGLSSRILILVAFDSTRGESMIFWRLQNQQANQQN